MAQIETNLQEAVKRLEQMQISGTQLEKTLFTLTKKVIQQARTKVSGDIKGSISNDPRQAYRAVKHMVYKSVLGGNISILDKRRRSGKVYPLPERKTRYDRGGNRIKRSKRTEDLLTYYGSDRGFILRFLNSGTGTRQSRYGHRGSIAARNFFMSAGQKEMEWAAQRLTGLIEQEIAKYSK